MTLPKFNENKDPIRAEKILEIASAVAGRLDGEEQEAVQFLIDFVANTGVELKAEYLAKMPGVAFTLVLPNLTYVGASDPEGMIRSMLNDLEVRIHDVMTGGSFAGQTPN